MPATRSRTFVAAFLMGACLTLRAQTAAPEKPRLPFPELPAVLWYDDFEAPSTLASGGKWGEAPNDPGRKAYQLGEVRFQNSTKVGARAELNLSNSGLNIPNGLNEAQILLEFKVWAEDVGDIQLEVTTQKGPVRIRGDHLTAAKWTPISIRLSQIPQLKPADTIVKIQVLYIPSTAVTFRKVYLDDFMALNGVRRSEDVMPLIQALIKRRQDMERNPEKDGFLFRAEHLEDLRQTLRAQTQRRKPRTVLVVPPRPQDGEALVQALQKAAPEARLSGYSFVPAEAPGGTPSGGLEDVRTLLPYNLNKSQAEFALIMFSYGDLQSGGCSPEVAGVAVDRALALGCVPVLIVPPLVAAPNRAKLEGVVKALNEMGASRSIVVVEASSQHKDAGNTVVQGELGPAGFGTTAAAALNAVKCLELHIFNRR